MSYRYLVETGSPFKKLYDGTDAADAMTAWSAAITEGTEYVTLEALRALPLPSVGGDPA